MDAFHHSPECCDGRLRVEFTISHERDEGSVTFTCLGCEATSAHRTTRAAVERMLQRFTDTGAIPRPATLTTH